MFAVPRDRLVRVHASSGTTGNPTTVGYTAGDIDALGRPHRPHAGRRRHAARRHAAERLRLRPVHRRPRPALRLRAPRRHGPADLRRQHRAPAQAHARLRRHGAVRARRRTPSTWPKRRATAACGPTTCPSAVGFHGAEPWTNEMRRQIEDGLGIDALDIYGLSEMGGPGRGLRVPLQGGHARQRGPLPGRDRRPETLRAAARGRGRRARRHHPEPGGPAAHPLPHPRPLQPHLRALRVRPHLRSHDQAGRAHRRHADHPRRQRLPQPDRRSPHDDPADRAALPDRGRPQGPPRHGRGLDRGRRGRLRRDHGPAREVRALGAGSASTACSTSRCR